MHEKEITQRIDTVYTSDQKIFEQILLKKWKNPLEKDANVSITTEPIEPQGAAAFDLGAFVRNFQYLPLDWKSRVESAEQSVKQSNEKPTQTEPQNEYKLSTFLAEQSECKTKIFDVLCNDDNVMRIPILNERAIDYYWTQFSQYFNADRKRTWRMLSNALKECLKLLQHREKLANKCLFQRRRYDELQYFFQNISASKEDHGNEGNK